MYAAVVNLFILKDYDVMFYTLKMSNKIILSNTVGKDLLQEYLVSKVCFGS